MPEGALLDTNLVLRLGAPETQHAVRTMQAAGWRLVVAPQSCVEAYVVATRPTAANGFGWTPAQAADLIAEIAAAFEVTPEPPDLLDRWRHLVVRADVRGVRAHDARLAAYAEVHRLGALVTHNVRDFAGLAAHLPLRIVAPADVREMTEPGIPGST